MELFLRQMNQVANWARSMSWFGLNALEWAGAVLACFALYRLVRFLIRCGQNGFGLGCRRSSVAPPVFRDEPLPMGKGEQVLVVDDEPFALRINCKMIRKLGYKVEGVTSGRLAMDFLKKNRTDLVVLDLVMPDLDGIQTLQRLRAICPDVKVIVLSGYARPAQVKELIGLGVGTYLVKPAPLDTLARAIRKELRMAVHKPRTLARALQSISQSISKGRKSR